MTAPTAEFFLIGDSHAVAIGDAALAAGRPFAGGPIGIGRQLECNFYRVEDGRFVLTTPQTAAHAAAHRDAFAGLLSFPGPILCALGFNSVRFACDLHAFLDSQSTTRWRDLLSQQVFAQCVLDARSAALAFYRLLATYDREVFFVPSPQRGPKNLRRTLLDFEANLIPAVTATGATLVDIRRTLGAHVADIAPEYRHPDDAVHGNTAYGARVLDAFDALRGKPSRPS